MNLDLNAILARAMQPATNEVFDTLFNGLVRLLPARIIQVKQAERLTCASTWI
jgi:hypothetical protein